MARDIRKYLFTTNLYNAPVETFCSLTKVPFKVPLLLIKVPPLILKLLLEFWIIVGFKGGSRQLKDFVVAVVM